LNENKASPPYILGICGGSGSGKTTVTDTFASFGALVINCDKVYSELISPSNPDRTCINEIALSFGKEAVLPDGTLNRGYIASCVFADEEKRSLLNKITHFHILNEVRNRIKDGVKNGIDFFAVDAPVLFESGFHNECTSTLAVICDREKRVARIMNRDGITREKALMRIDAQTSDEYISLRSDYTIDNSGTEEALRKKASDFFADTVLPYLEREAN